MGLDAGSVYNVRMMTTLTDAEWDALPFPTTEYNWDGEDGKQSYLVKTVKVGSIEIGAYPETYRLVPRSTKEAKQ